MWTWIVENVMNMTIWTWSVKNVRNKTIWTWIVKNVKNKTISLQPPRTPPTLLLWQAIQPACSPVVELSEKSARGVLGGGGCRQFLHSFSSLPWPMEGRQRNLAPANRRPGLAHMAVCVPYSPPSLSPPNCALFINYNVVPWYHFVSLLLYLLA